MPPQAALSVEDLELQQCRFAVSSGSDSVPAISFYRPPQFAT